MAIAALRTLVSQIPSWQNRLNGLVDDINTRQDELSRIENGTANESPAPNLEQDAKTAGTKSTPKLQPPADNMNVDSAPSAASRQPTTHSIVGNGPMAVAKKKKLEPVYFDGSMQKFFEELVHFLAVSRNMMRKAKMAARVAQIKKMAEVEISDGLGDGISERPTLRYVSSRRLDALGPAPSSNGGARPGCEPDIFDTLDKNLDTLQTTSELAAFQFLREASNSRHMQTIGKILGDVLDTATAELARLARDEPDMVREADAAAARTKRPLSMRRELPAGAKQPAAAESPNKRQNTGHLTPSPSLPSIGHMEVDLAALQNDEPVAPQVIHLPANVRV